MTAMTPPESRVDIVLETHFISELDEAGTLASWSSGWFGSSGISAIRVAVTMGNPAAVFVEEGVFVSGDSAPDPLKYTVLPTVAQIPLGYGDGVGNSDYQTSATVELTGRYFQIVIIGNYGEGAETTGGVVTVRTVR